MTPTHIRPQNSYRRNHVSRLLLLTALAFVNPITLHAIIPEGDPILDTSENMCVNGDFEQHNEDPANARPLRWWVHSTGLQTVAVSTTHNHTAGILGPATPTSLKVTDGSATASVIIRSEKRAANVGTTYTVDGWIWNESGTSGNIFLEFWDANNARVGVVSSPTSAAAAWTAITTLSLAAPAGTTHVNVAIATTQTPTGVSYFDDIKLKAAVAYSATIDKNVRELFIDDYRLESLFNISRVATTPTKSGPLFPSDKAWESGFLVVDTVLKDKPAGSGYKMWYHSNGQSLYATSPDGNVWTKPTLNSYDFPVGSGNTANNIAFEENHIRGAISVVYDDADPDSGKRYKAMQNRFNGTINDGYYVFFSPTGTGTWSIGNGGARVFPFHDVVTVAYKQPAPGMAGTFIATHKQDMYDAKTTVGYNVNRYDRAAFVSTSTNFTTWTAPNFPGATYALAVEGDFADDWRVRAKRGWEAQIYGMPVYPYESTYLGFPWMFEIMNYSKGAAGGYGDGPIFAGIASSRDLRIWGRPVRDAVIPNGLQGDWDDGAIYTSNTMQIGATDVTVYYGGSTVGHGGEITTLPPELQFSKIGKATWRRDGFVALRNGGSSTVGQVATKTLVVPAGAITNIVVNTKLNAGGTLKVEILNSAGGAIAAYSAGLATPISGDQQAAVASWASGNNIASLAGQTIKLKFYLSGGDIYSYWFQ